MRSLKIFVMLLLNAPFLTAQNDGPFRDLKMVSIQNFQDVPASKQLSCEVLITNAGNMTLDLTGVILHFKLSKDQTIDNADDIDAGGRILLTGENAPLEPGQSRLLSGRVSYGLKNLFDYPFAIGFIDYSKIITEPINLRSNNRLLVTHGFPLKADLHPVLEANGTFVQFRQEGTSIIFKVKNSGQVASGKSVCSFQYLTGGHQPVHSITVPSIPAGSEVEVKAPAPNHPCSQNCKFRVKVDAKSTIRETNEDNNQAEGIILG